MWNAGCARPLRCSNPLRGSAQLSLTRAMWFAIPSSGALPNPMPKPTKTSPPEPATEGLVSEYGQAAKLPVKEDELRRFAAAALAELKAPELTLGIVDAAAGRQLTRRWRGTDIPADVLT